MLEKIKITNIFTFLLSLFLAACLTLFLVFPVRAATRYETGISTSASLTWVNDDTLNQRLDDIKSMGATWVRVDFRWPVIQPDNADDYRWRQYDKVVDATSKRGLKILAMVAYTPAWAQDQTCAQKTHSDYEATRCAPADPMEFGRFAGAIAHHYQGQNIRGWEIWNEPNMTAFWKSPQPDGQLSADPVMYSRVANVAAWNIRIFNPDAVIVTGGLSPLFEPRYPRGIRQSDFLREMLPHLEKDLFTGIGIHPYSWPVLPTKVADYNAFYTVDQGKEEYNLRFIMDQAGWGDKEIWGTEFGASTRGQRTKMSVLGRPDHVSEQMQAAIISVGLKAWYQKQNVGPMFVHSDSDKWLARRENNEEGFGLRREDGSEKPAYNSFKYTVQHDL